MEAQNPHAADALTTSEAARYLRVSESHLNKLRCLSPEKGPPFFRLGRAVRYPAAELASWIAERTMGGSVR